MGIDYVLDNLSEDYIRFSLASFSLFLRSWCKLGHFSVLWSTEVALWSTEVGTVWSSSV